MLPALLTLLLSSVPPTVATPSDPDVFPMAVWYGGGKARAPMLEADPGAKKEVWRRDLRQIRALGFNAVRCWIDWASGEPAPGLYRLDTLDVLLSLAEEEGLKVVVQVYMDSAPEWVGRQHPDALFVSSNGQAIRPESSPGYCMDHPGVRKADLAFYEAVRVAPGRAPPSSASTSGASPTSSTGRTRPTSRTPSSASAGTPWRASGSG